MSGIIATKAKENECKKNYCLNISLWPAAENECDTVHGSDSSIDKGDAAG
jgi:hypothetical protein